MDEKVSKPEGEEETNLSTMKKMLDTKVDGKKSVWAMTLETFGMADAKNKKNDILVDTLPEALEIFNDYVTELKKEDDNLMTLVPLEEFKATQDQFLTAFLRWAENESTKDETKRQINVSKARRRLDAYFEWMKANAENFEEALTIESIAPAAKIWDIQISYDEDGHFWWWIDIGGADKEKIKKLEPKDHLRYMVWFSHFMMFDTRAQENGCKLIEDMGQIGFLKAMTLVPPDLGAKLDRLTIGILPVKMKALYVSGAARWMGLLMGLKKPFMGKKMLERVIMVPKNKDLQEFCDELVTRKNIPKDFCGLQGEAARDLMFEKSE